MICLLVSSKTMGTAKKAVSVSCSAPLLIREATVLHGKLKSLSLPAIEKLMHVSANLAVVTKHTIDEWSPEGETPAWLSFQGDVYKGLKAESFTNDDFVFAQKCAATISGLYGILRPLDLVTPYRLEIGYKLAVSHHKNLYAFWNDSIVRTLPHLQDDAQPIINLSSEEYIKAIRPYVNQNRIITPWFMQIKDGAPVFQAIHAKIARGTMMRWIIKNRITNAAQLRHFCEDRYTFDAALSTPSKPVFTRLFIAVGSIERSPTA
jgi:cytoplasmic iron level regulating protein YaaA (DUF328/UPF0246 family)